MVSTARPDDLGVVLPLTARATGAAAAVLPAPPPATATAARSPTTKTPRLPVGRGGVDEDASLVARAVGGDRTAFAELFARHHGRIHRVCARLVPARELDDAVQTTFVEAWRGLPRFEGRSRFSTWLVRIALHTCSSLRRRLRRLLLTPDARALQAPAMVLLHGSDADWRLRARDQAVALQKALARVPDKKRVALVLCDLEGYAPGEVAEILGVPEATVRTRLFYARRVLVAALRDHPAFDRLDAAATRHWPGAPR
jgi:RNA polymerase sigma factor (sigma-70 family)